jgi:hypothetical protein
LKQRKIKCIKIFLFFKKKIGWIRKKETENNLMIFN